MMIRLVGLVGLVALLGGQQALAHDVVDMTSDFEGMIKEHDVALVKFYAPWCGHCKRLAPEFEKASTTLKKNDPSVTLADVDCTEEGGKDACSKFGVSGYPTLKIFRNGEVSQDYNGPRQADGIVKYMKAQVGPSSKEIKSKDDFEKLLKRDETVIFGAFKEKDSELQKAFQKLADKHREQYTFAHTNDAGLADSKKLSDDVVIIRAKKFQSKFEDSEIRYDGSPDTVALESFIRKQYFGLVGHRTQDNYQQFDSPLLIAYYDVDYEKNTKGTNYWRNRIMKAIKEYAGKSLSFAISNKEQFGGEMDEFGLKAGDKPSIGIRNEKQQKFRMSGEFSIDALNQFVKDYFDGKLEPHFKSEEIPESNDGPVKVAVAKNFEDLVTKSEKDILIEFYAPWCGHCKNLAPAYEEVGKAMEGENVDIVKMDATANDVPGPFEVQGFPTLFWLPKDDKANPRKYEGGRDAKDFIKYIAKHATEELNKYDRSGAEKKAKSEL